MTPNSIRATLEAAERKRKESITVNDTIQDKERKKFFTDNKNKRQNFLSKLRQQEQRFNQRQQIEVENKLSALKWKKVFGSQTETVFFNKQFPGAYLRIMGDQFGIYKNPKKAPWGFEGETPVVGLLAVEQMESELAAFKG